MKYIRTKDGIIDIDNFINKKENYSIRSIKGTYEEKARFVYFMKCGINQADTIEELCDGFIIGETLKIYNKSNFNFEKKIVNLGHKEYCKFENLKSICGVIMTFENGIPRIITVAKMNEEGELKLL